jgi:hypothetical protein
MSYYQSGGVLIVSCHPPLPRLGMVGCCVLSAEAAATSPAANQWQHHLENVYVSRKLELIKKLSTVFWINFSKNILATYNLWPD